MFEEVSTLVVAVAIAGALLAAGVAVFAYFNPQQPVDHANAAFFPLVRPLNETHVQLGVRPLADYVEVAEVAWSYNAMQGRVPVRLVARNATWLTYGGRPVAMPCGANVTVATRYGAASRALNFHVACLRREPELRTNLTALYQNLVTYASYVADYVAYRTTPVLAAYLGFGPTTGYEVFELYETPRYGPIYVGFQNVGPFPYVAAPGAPSGGGIWPPPGMRVAALRPNELVRLYDVGSSVPYFNIPLKSDADLYICRFLNQIGRDSFGNPIYDGECSVMYRWLNIYVRWHDNLEIWVNNVRVYNGTEPFLTTEYMAPQGFKVVFSPENGTLYVKYESVAYACSNNTGWCRLRGWVWRVAEKAEGGPLSLYLYYNRTAYWSGWVKMINTYAPTSPLSVNERWNVMPAGAHVNHMENATDVFAVVPHFEVYSVYAFHNGSGLVVRWVDADCGLSERCVRAAFYPRPGLYRITIGRADAGLPLYTDGFYTVAATSAFWSSSRCGSTQTCVTIGWYAPDVRDVVIIYPSGNSHGYGLDGKLYNCDVRTNGAVNTVPLEDGRYWSLECWYRESPGWSAPKISMGVVELRFHSNRSISVYRDGKFIHRVPVRHGYLTWPPASTASALVHWGPGGIAIAVAPFVRNENSLGYGDVYVASSSSLEAPLAYPVYWRYDLTGAYPYRLEVRINATEKEVLIEGIEDENLIYYYYNVTYSGYLKLYLDDRLVAYDALHGWTVVRKREPPPGALEPVAFGRPASFCVPQVTRIPKGQEHGNLIKGEKGYYVEVYNKYEVHEKGCGVDRKYEQRVKAGAFTVNGHWYHVHDGQNTCGYELACNRNGQVICVSRPEDCK